MLRFKVCYCNKTSVLLCTLLAFPKIAIVLNSQIKVTYILYSQYNKEKPIFFNCKQQIKRTCNKALEEHTLSKLQTEVNVSFATYFKWRKTGVHMNHKVWHTLKFT